MAAESPNRPGSAAGSASVFDRILRSSIDGRAHRRRRPRQRTGCLVRDGHVSRGDASSSLDPRSESLSAIHRRRAGSGAGGRPVRSAARCRLSDVLLRTEAVESASTIVGTSGVDRGASLRLRVGGNGAVGVEWPSRLRGIFAASAGAVDESDNARSRVDDQCRRMPGSSASRFISPAPGATDDRSDRRGRSRPKRPGRVHTSVRSCQTRFDGTDRPCVRSLSDRSRVRAARVQHRPVPLSDQRVHQRDREGD